MATVRLVESGADDGYGYGYLTIDNYSQAEIENIISSIVQRLNKECISEDDVPSWCIEDITTELTDKGYKWCINEEYEVGI